MNKILYIMLFFAFGNTIQAQEEIFIINMLVQRVGDSKQKINSTNYPFDASLDSSRIYKDNKKIKVPLNFSVANFYQTTFAHSLDFSHALFDAITNFEEVHFMGKAEFNCAQFNNITNFKNAKFDSLSSFFCSSFQNKVEFIQSDFNSLTLFGCTNFNELVNFWGSRFDGNANFSSVNFASDVVFDVAHFYGLAYFGHCTFNGRANFNTSQFFCSGDFYSATFNSEADFRDAGFKNLSFERTEIKSKMFLGSQKGQKYDFTRTIFSSNTKLILCELVDLNIQQEKIRHIFLCDTLNYILV